MSASNDTPVPKRFLIVQTAFIGDVVLATPLIEKLKAFFPNAKIDFLLRKGNEGLLRGHPKLNDVLIWDKKRSKYGNLAGLGVRIRSNRYDVLINLQRFASSGLLTTFSNAKTKIGFTKNPFSALFDVKVEHVIDQKTHETERNLKLIEHLTDKSYFRPALYPTDEDHAKAAPYKKGIYFCVAPASVWFTKQFPAEKWVELIDRLNPDHRIYLIGSPADLALCADIRSRSIQGNIHLLAGELNFLQSASLMKGARMNFVNDSAPMHLASAVNAPVTAVYCSTLPEFGFGPLSDNSKVVQIDYPLPCRPCGLHGKKSCPEKHFKCAFDIDVSKIPTT